MGASEEVPDARSLVHGAGAHSARHGGPDPSPDDEPGGNGARLDPRVEQLLACQRRATRRLGWSIAVLLVNGALCAATLYLVADRRDPSPAAGESDRPAPRAGSDTGDAARETAQITTELASLRDRVAVLGRERARLEEQLRSQVALAEKLRHESIHKDEALQDALGRLELLAEASRERAESAARSGFEPLGEEPGRAARDPMVEAINLLFIEGGLLTYRLLHVDDVDRERQVLRGTIWSLCNERGTAVGGVYAARCRIRIDPTARAAQVILEDGQVTQGGVKRPFDGGTLGFVVAGVDVERWAGLLEGIASVEGGARVADSGEQAVAPTPSVESGAETPTADPVTPAGELDPTELEETTDELRALLAPEGYDVVALRGIRGGVLRDIRIEKVLATGHAKAIEARECRIYRVRPAGYIEMLFRGGFVEDRGKQHPFVGESYRLPLPGVDGETWKGRLGKLVMDRG